VDAFIHLSSGLRHHYVKGEGSGTPILFLHGFVDSSRSFEALLEKFPLPAASFRLDFRGHGETEPATSYAVADLAADAIEFIERVIGTPATVVGHSMGSIVAQRVASLRPDLVRELVLIGAAPTAANHPELSELRAEIAKFDEVVPRDFVEAFQRSTVYAPISEAAINGYIEESGKVGIGAWRGALSGLLDEPPSDAQPVAIPALVLWGANDGVFGADAQEALARLLPLRKTVHYDDAGHAPHWEFPARVAQDIDTFLRERSVG
jgi:pimeloyl-ACP methyl ester carboxylesterase